ncbi:MAG: peptide chain release factor N(5)-glutamine methyltransferase [bacterium]
MIVREAVAAAATRLREAGSDSPELDAEVLLGHVMGRSRAGVVARRPDALGLEHAAAFEELVIRRARREPVSLLLGCREFRSLDFRVNAHVLAPRPETEALVEAALRHIDAGARRVVDVGTGSGAVAISLAAARAEVAELQLLAVDLSAPALGVARRNATHLLPAADGVAFFRGSLVDALADASLDLVVSNPPYLSATELAAAPPELAFEPELALLGGDLDGLGVFRELVVASRRVLCSEGGLLVEIGAPQGEVAARVAREEGFGTVAVLPDLAGRDRVLQARAPKA